MNFKLSPFTRAHLLIGGLLMISLLVLAPAQAQDAPDPSMSAPAVTTPLPQENDAVSAAPSAPLMYAMTGVLAVLLVGTMLYGGYLTRFLATLVPPETASAIYASGVRFGFQIALNHAAQTPSTLDDEFFEEMARLRGLQVFKRPDGSYEVKQPPAPPRMPV